MAWETRSRGTRYYTRSRWVDGRVVREYIGCGEKGERAAQIDAQRRAQRQAERAACRAFEAEHNAADAPLLELIDSADLLMQATLLATGFHQHKRGEWRRRRVRKDARQTYHE